MSDFVRTIITMSLTGSILALILFALKPLVHNRLPKSTQYYLWLVVIIALLVPVSRIITLAEGQAAPIPATAIINETLTRFVITQEEQARLHSAAYHSISGTPHSVEAYLPQGRQSPIAVFFTYFVLVYPIGVLGLGLYYVVNYMFFVGMLRRRNKPAGDYQVKLLRQMCAGRGPRLYVNPLAATPMLLGVFRPAIILPEREYAPQQLFAILSHELLHLRRKDTFVKWLALIASALHWFNPVMWLMRREIDRACELSCDEAVIRGLNTEGRRNYGNTLIAVSADPKAPRAVASATMCEEKKNLKERLGAIMRSKRHTRTALALSALLIVAAVAAVLIFGMGSSNTPGIAAGENSAGGNGYVNAPQEGPGGNDEPGEDMANGDDEEPSGNGPPTNEPEATINSLNIDRMSEELLAGFASVREVDFLQGYSDFWGLEEDHHFFSIEGDWGVVIWADAILRDIHVLMVDYEETATESIPFAASTIYVINELPAGTALFLYRFVTVGGVLPREGFSFTDPSGTRRYFAIADDRRGYPGDPPYFLLEFESGVGWVANARGETPGENEPPATADAPAEPTPAPESPPAWTIEELGATIEAAGTFWNDWWFGRGAFAWDEHVAPWVEGEMPEHLAMLYARLLPSSGFESINDIRNYLLRYYTECWVDSELFGSAFPAFVEYDGILYIHGIRMCFGDRRWETATHILVEQDGSHAVVETTVLAWHGEIDAYVESRYYFIFVDGRITNTNAPYSQ